MAKASTQFAIGLSHDMLLVQHVSIDPHGPTDITKMFLIHRRCFQPNLQQIVLADEKSHADMIAYLFMADWADKGYRTHVSSRKYVDNTVKLQAFEI